MKGRPCLPLEDLKQKIKDVHGNRIQILSSVAVRMHEKTRFLDVLVGEYEATPHEVVNLKKVHPLAKQLPIQIVNLAKSINFKQDRILFFEDEVRTKPAIVRSIINQKSGLTVVKLNARDCEIETVLAEKARKFLTECHLMGYKNGASYIGLVKDGEVVSLLGYAVKGEVIKIERFASKLNTSVRGGLSRLLKQVELIHPKLDIHYWVDGRYGTGSGVISLGFEYVRTTQGWKWTDGKNTYNRLACRAGNGLTEKEKAAKLGWWKIKDAGQLLFVKKNNYM